MPAPCLIAGATSEAVVRAEPVSQRRHVSRPAVTAPLPLRLSAVQRPPAATRRPLRAAVAVRRDAVSASLDVCGRRRASSRLQVCL